RLAQLLPERLGSVHVHVDPDEVDQLARAHRPTGAVLHPRVEILRRDARLVENADAIVEERDQDAVDDEARCVMAADRRLAEAIAAIMRAQPARSASWVVSVSRPTASSRPACSIVPFSTLRVRKCAMRSRARSARARVTSWPTVSTPASTQSCAIPAPIAPSPTT